MRSEGSFSIVDTSLASWKAGGRELEAVPIVAGGAGYPQGGSMWLKVVEGGIRWHRDVKHLWPKKIAHQENSTSRKYQKVAQRIQVAWSSLQSKPPDFQITITVESLICDIRNCWRHR